MDILKQYSNELNEFCKANKIERLSLFGSYLKDVAKKESDVDLLVEFAANTEYGMLDVARMERELSEIVGRKVDLRTQEELSKYFRDTIVKEAQIKYEARR